jgi:hypothetical protein
MELTIWLTPEDLQAGEDPEIFQGGSLDELKQDLLEEWLDEVIEEGDEIHQDILLATDLASLIDTLTFHGFYTAH